MELLSYKQFATRYPFCCADSTTPWAIMLQKWRESGELVERDHWKFGRVEEKMGRLYNPVKVIRLIIKEARGDNPRPRISYLYQTYLEEFVIVLEAFQASRALANKESPST